MSISFPPWGRGIGIYIWWFCLVSVLFCARRIEYKIVVRGERKKNEILTYWNYKCIVLTLFTSLLLLVCSYTQVSQSSQCFNVSLCFTQFARKKKIVPAGNQWNCQNLVSCIAIWLVEKYTPIRQLDLLNWPIIVGLLFCFSEAMCSFPFWRPCDKICWYTYNLLKCDH